MAEQATHENRGVRMREDGAWDFVRHSINGVVTTLRRDGRPVALPVWFVLLDERIFISTRGKKLAAILRNTTGIGPPGSAGSDLVVTDLVAARSARLRSRSAGGF